MLGISRSAVEFVNERHPLILSTSKNTMDVAKLGWELLNQEDSAKVVSRFISTISPIKSVLFVASGKLQLHPIFFFKSTEERKAFCQSIMSVFTLFEKVMSPFLKEENPVNKLGKLISHFYKFFGMEKELVSLTNQFKDRQVTHKQIVDSSIAVVEVANIGLSYTRYKKLNDYLGRILVIANFYGSIAAILAPSEKTKPDQKKT